MSRQLKIGLFGGTFDPIHNGHLALARAARRRFHLDCIYFIPSGLPPHKQARGLSPFLHRYAMVTLACAHLSRAARIAGKPGDLSVRGDVPARDAEDDVVELLPAGTGGFGSAVIGQQFGGAEASSRPSRKSIALE